MSNIIIFDVIGFVLILFVVWWFWMASSEKITKVPSSGKIKILVKDGAYKPAQVQAKVNQSITFEFLRKDVSGCSGTVVFTHFNQSAELPLGEPVLLTITPKEVGEFPFTCQMGMYRGKLIVRA